MTIPARITPLIMAGGKGSRLWPTSTPDLPKQFIPLKVGGTTFENALHRVENKNIFAKPLIICAERNIQTVQYLSRGRDVSVICEPLGRNTAAACCIGALAAQDAGHDSELMLILPADHYIPDIQAFEDTVVKAVDVARSGKIVMFGIQPEFGCTEYGYIECSEKLGASELEVKRFVEKPDVKKADAYFESGNYLWNSGIFLVRADVVLFETRSHLNDLFFFAKRAWDGAKVTDGYTSLPVEEFMRLPDISFDYGVMEHTQSACVIKAGFKWSDLGGWDALMEFLPPDRMTS